MAELVVSPTARLPVGRQVETQLARAVLEGRIPMGAPLPSTRRLAGRLPVHRNTVAATYRRLARRGLVRLERGARARVAVDSSVAFRGAGIRESSARARGVAVVVGCAGTRELAVHELRSLFGEIPVAGFESPQSLAGSGAPSRRVAVVELDQLAEARRVLMWRLARATAQTTPDPAETSPAASTPTGALESTGAPGPTAAVGSAPDLAWGLLPLLHAGLEAFRDFVLGARSPEVVAVLSVAPELRRALRETAGALRGDEVAVLTPEPDDREAVEYGLRCASAAWVDGVVGSNVPAGGCTGSSSHPCARIHPLRLVSGRTVRELRALMEPRDRGTETA